MPKASTIERAPALAPETSLSSSFEDLEMFHTPVYVTPSDLIDSDDVRPGETPDQHIERVDSLVSQILADGQQTPIKIKEVDGKWKVVDGQGRTDALRIIEQRRKSNGEDILPAWCVIDSSADSWASAVKLNVQRRNYTDVQLADLITEARKRYGWGNKGGGRKLAEFFGITEQHLVEYNKIAELPADVKDKLNAGEITKHAALQLVRTTSSSPAPAATKKRSEVIEKAREIAEKSAPAAAAVTPVKEGAKEGGKGKKQELQLLPAGSIKDDKKTDPPNAAAATSAPRKVEAKHIVEAARQVAAEAGESAPVVKRGLTELIAAINQLLEFSPVSTDQQLHGHRFLMALLKFRDGELSPKQLQNRWNTVIGAAEKVASEEKKAPAKAEKAEKIEKPAKKAEVKAPAKVPVKAAPKPKADKPTKAPAKSTAKSKKQK